MDSPKTLRSQPDDSAVACAREVAAALDLIQQTTTGFTAILGLQLLLIYDETKNDTMKITY
jgi:hypothetical protein